MTLAEIKKRLSDRNLAEVARRIGCTRSYLQAITSEKQPLSDRMQDKLTKYLNAHK